MIWMLPALAAPQPAPDAAEEIIVWARPFARFDDKRWHVQTEVITPMRQPFGTAQHQVWSNAWQVEAIIHCRLDGSDRDLRETICTIERAAVRVHVEKGKSKDTESIRQMANWLKGMRVQLQVNAKGRVPNLDLDGLSERNERERDLVLAQRTLLQQVQGAFHMEIPKENPIGASWVSYQEPILGMVSSFPGMSTVEVAHRIDPLDGHWVQQSSGRATSTIPVPNPRAGMMCFPSDPDNNCPQGRVSEPPHLRDLEFTYALDLNAVSVIDPDAGYPTERVWSVLGSPTASSPGQPGDYWTAGKLQMLQPDQVVPLGRSGLVAARGTRNRGGLLPWVSFAER